jgi:hypothetical protein
MIPEMLRQQRGWKGNCDVKIQKLANLETHQRLYCVWSVIGLGRPWGRGVMCRTTMLPVVQLAVTLLQLSYGVDCNNTQHCLKLPTYCCTAVKSKLIDFPDHQVIIIAVTDSYTSFLSDDEPLCGFDSRWFHRNFSLPYPFQPHYGAGVNRN